MTEHVLIISIGPVQEFISAARRTSDLFSGSQLLVSIVGAAAQTLSDSERIFPVNPTAGGANKILAIVADPQAAFDQAARAAQVALETAWKSALTQISSKSIKHIDTELATRQLDTFLECQAAWAPITESGYSGARRTAETLLLGRKIVRNFPAANQQDLGRPKSPLDPTRASVVNKRGGLTAPDSLNTTPTWLKKTETLDAISLLKRVLGQKFRDPEHIHIPTTRDLAERANHPGALAKVDAQTEPSFNYYAVLVADGDNMGDTIDNHDTTDRHREISRVLDDFAAAAKTIVEAHDGLLVYAGGDDVLALLPVTQVVAAATKLAADFETKLAPFAFSVADETRQPTLSAGVAICHYKDPLSGSLNRARQAEKLAKVEKNRLVVTLNKRSGSPLRAELLWGDPFLTTWQTAFTDQTVSKGLPYKLLRLASELPDDSSANTYVFAEAKRIQDHSDPPKADGPTIPRVTSNVELMALAERMVLARYLAGIK